MRLSKAFLLSVGFLILAVGSALAQSDQLVGSLGLKGVEKANLDKSVPSRMRDFLETADQFEVFAQLEIQDGKLQPAMGLKLVPNFKAVITAADKRNALLKSLYSEASKAGIPAICYLPSHSIVANKGDQKVTVEICFGCNRFYISGSLGDSEGTFSNNRGKTEKLISDLIAKSGVKIN
jgi:hypothetical protein